MSSAIPFEQVYASAFFGLNRNFEEIIRNLREIESYVAEELGIQRNFAKFFKVSLEDSEPVYSFYERFQKGEAFDFSNRAYIRSAEAYRKDMSEVYKTGFYPFPGWVKMALQNNSEKDDLSFRLMDEGLRKSSSYKETIKKVLSEFFASLNGKGEFSLFRDKIYQRGLKDFLWQVRNELDFDLFKNLARVDLDLELTSKEVIQELNKPKYIKKLVEEIIPSYKGDGRGYSYPYEEIQILFSFVLMPKKVWLSASPTLKYELDQMDQMWRYREQSYFMPVDSEDREIKEDGTLDFSLNTAFSRFIMDNLKKDGFLDSDARGLQWINLAYPSGGKNFLDDLGGAKYFAKLLVDYAKTGDNESFLKKKDIHNSFWLNTRIFTVSLDREALFKEGGTVTRKDLAELTSAINYYKKNKDLLKKCNFEESLEDFVFESLYFQKEPKSLKKDPLIKDIFFKYNFKGEKVNSKKEYDEVHVYLKSSNNRKNVSFTNAKNLTVHVLKGLSKEFLDSFNVSIRYENQEQPAYSEKDLFCLSRQVRKRNAFYEEFNRLKEGDLIWRDETSYGEVGHQVDASKEFLTSYFRDLQNEELSEVFYNFNFELSLNYYENHLSKSTSKSPFNTAFFELLESKDKVTVQFHSKREGNFDINKEHKTFPQCYVKKLKASWLLVDIGSILDYVVPFDYQFEMSEGKLYLEQPSISFGLYEVTDYDKVDIYSLIHSKLFINVDTLSITDITQLSFTEEGYIDGRAYHSSPIYLINSAKDIAIVKSRLFASPMQYLPIGIEGNLMLVCDSTDFDPSHSGSFELVLSTQVYIQYWENVFEPKDWLPIMAYYNDQSTAQINRWEYKQNLPTQEEIDELLSSSQRYDNISVKYESMYAFFNRIGFKSFIDKDSFYKNSNFIAYSYLYLLMPQVFGRFEEHSLFDQVSLKFPLATMFSALFPLGVDAGGGDDELADIKIENPNQFLKTGKLFASYLKHPFVPPKADFKMLIYPKEGDVFSESTVEEIYKSKDPIFKYIYSFTDFYTRPLALLYNMLQFESGARSNPLLRTDSKLLAGNFSSKNGVQEYAKLIESSQGREFASGNLLTEDPSTIEKEIDRFLQEADIQEFEQLFDLFRFLKYELTQKDFFGFEKSDLPALFNDFDYKRQYRELLLKSLLIEDGLSIKVQTVFDVEGDFLNTTFSRRLTSCIYSLARFWSLHLSPLYADPDFIGFFNEKFLKNKEVSGDRLKHSVDLKDILYSYEYTNGLKKILKNKSVNLDEGKAPITVADRSKNPIPYSIIRRSLQAFRGQFPNSPMGMEGQVKSFNRLPLGAFFLVYTSIAVGYRALLNSANIIEGTPILASSKTPIGTLNIIQETARPPLEGTQGSSLLSAEDTEIESRFAKLASNYSLCIGQEDYGYIKDAKKGNIDVFTAQVLDKEGKVTNNFGTIGYQRRQGTSYKKAIFMDTSNGENNTIIGGENGTATLEFYRVQFLYNWLASIFMNHFKDADTTPHVFEELFLNSPLNQVFKRTLYSINGRYQKLLLQHTYSALKQQLKEKVGILVDNHVYFFEEDYMGSTAFSKFYERLRSEIYPILANGEDLEDLDVYSSTPSKIFESDELYTFEDVILLIDGELQQDYYPALKITDWSGDVAYENAFLVDHLKHDKDLNNLNRFGLVTYLYNTENEKLAQRFMDIIYNGTPMDRFYRNSKDLHKGLLDKIAYHLYEDLEDLTNEYNPVRDLIKDASTIFEVEAQNVEMDIQHQPLWRILEKR